MIAYFDILKCLKPMQDMVIDFRILPLGLNHEINDLSWVFECAYRSQCLVANKLLGYYIWCNQIGCAEMTGSPVKMTASFQRAKTRSFGTISDFHADICLVHTQGPENANWHGFRLRPYTGRSFELASSTLF